MKKSIVGAALAGAMLAVPTASFAGEGGCAYGSHDVKSTDATPAGMVAPVASTATKQPDQLVYLQGQTAKPASTAK